MMLIQVLGVLFALFALSRVILRMGEKALSKGEFLFWCVVWIGVIAVALIPRIAHLFSSRLGIGRPIDVVVYASIILLFYLIFRIYIKIDKIEQNITSLVREQSIRERRK